MPAEISHFWDKILLTLDTYLPTSGAALPQN